MKVFKFGGASIKDASSIKNILEILSNYSNDNLLIVVSAMGKTTNALEKVVENYFKNKSGLKSSILEVLNFHIFQLTMLQLTKLAKRKEMYRKSNIFLGGLSKCLTHKILKQLLLKPLHVNLKKKKI